MDTKTVCNKKGIEDVAFIQGLKSRNSQLTRTFFYEEIAGGLKHVQFNLFNGCVEYDELVSELYIFLAADAWRKLDTFEGKNGSHLKTWMSPVAWRFFMSNYDRLMERESTEDSLDRGDVARSTDKSIEIAMDVNAVLKRMPNRRYAEALEWLLLKGYSAEELAKMWGTNAANVYNIKHRAIQQFGELYGR